jgi:hypothetical protein
MLQIQETAPNSTLLRRNECARILTSAGFPISPKTLATMASRGGGPPFYKFGRAVLYRWSDALAWAESRLSPLRRSTSEVDQQQITHRSA